MEHKIRLHKVIKKIGISAEEIAKKCGISYDTVNAILHNEKPIPDSLIGKLYRLYGKDIFF